ncbi:tRNA pseudouridine55 synthase [Rhodoligotrophos appendicifer]|uniref:tRNA pseudouridine(55) synthase TruB n=1 Tax=Rhodoligotrophos appendicifer TaxID=987056 RepID=UPI00117D62B3|nr:tRNA pseudouridine(55) synthase TruB [Rhodoligotrophos appendicifer]
MARRRKGDAVNGWILLDKPQGLTSTQAVARVKRLFNAQKAGHGGTLDPLATGMLPIALGEATKTVSYVVEGSKDYRFTVRWGQETNTDDTEGQVTAESTIRPTPEEVDAILDRFIGRIMQTPPQFSAIKIAGERAYDLARSGEEVLIPPREVFVAGLDLIEVLDADHFVFETECGPGTYVRALARDMGRLLGCHGHVTELRRMRVGALAEEDMISLEELEDLSDKDPGREALLEVLRPVGTALDDIPALAIGSADAARLQRGQPVVMRGRDAPVLNGTLLVELHGKPVALVEVRDGALQPKRVFNLT